MREGPFQPLPRPVSALVCGDFNMPPEDALHARMLANGFVDAWAALQPGTPHPATFHVFEGGKTPCCYDYVFASEDLAPRLRSIRVDGAKRAQLLDAPAVRLEVAPAQARRRAHLYE
jgi:endonuclease/exonuclease/phosphatase family metal-dependent hydrolase